MYGQIKYLVVDVDGIVVVVVVVVVVVDVDVVVDEPSNSTVIDALASTLPVLVPIVFSTPPTVPFTVTVHNP